MILKHLSIFILLIMVGSNLAWSSGAKSHEIKDLFETIRGKVLGLVFEKHDAPTVTISSPVAEFECSSSQREEHNTIENLTSEWRSTRPKNLEAELPKVCLLATGHLSKGFCPTDLRSQFEFNFFIDATDCYNVPQKQVLTFLYSLPHTSKPKFEKGNLWNADRSSCQRIQTLLQVLEDGSLKDHVTNVLLRVSLYAQTQRELTKLVRNKRLSEEESVQWSLASMKKPQQFFEFKSQVTRLPAQAKKSQFLKLDFETKEWFSIIKSDEDKLNSALGNGVCTMTPLR